MDGRQRIPVLQRFGRCRKLRSGKAIIKQLALQEAWEKYGNADSESDTSAVLPESLFQPSEDVKPPILKPPSPISRRRLYEVTSSNRALQSTSQDTTPSTVRIIRKEPEFSVQPHPIATKFRILRNPPARIKSVAPPFSQQFPSIFDGMSTMEKVVRVERELELEELVRNEDYGQSSMEVTREVAIREYYETLTPYKQFLFKDRMDRMGEQLPSAVIRSRPNVRPADFLRSTSPLFMPTSLMENPLAGIALQEIQDEERIIECKQRTGKIFVTVGLFPDDLDFDKADIGCSRVRKLRYKPRAPKKDMLPGTSLGGLTVYKKAPEVLLLPDERPLFGLKIEKIRTHDGQRSEDIDVGDAGDLINGPVLLKPVVKLPTREKPPRPPLSTSPIFDGDLNIVATEIVKSRLKGFNAVRIKKTSFAKDAPQSTSSSGSSQERSNSSSREPAVKKLKLESDVQVPETHSTSSTAGTSPVKIKEEIFDESYEEPCRAHQRTAAPVNIKREPMDLQTVDTRPPVNVSENPEPVVAVNKKPAVNKEKTNATRELLIPKVEPTAEGVDDCEKAQIKAEDEEAAHTTPRPNPNAEDDGHDVEQFLGPQPQRESVSSETIGTLNRRVFLVNKDGQVSEKEVKIRVQRRKAVVADNSKEAVPPEAQNPPIIDMEKLLEVDDVHKPCEWCNRVLSPNMLRVHKTEQAEFGECGITQQTYKCPYIMCAGEQEKDTLDKFCLHLLFEHNQPAVIHDRVFHNQLEFFEWIYRFQERGDYHCVKNPEQRNTRFRMKQFQCIYTKPSGYATMPDFPDSSIMTEIPKTTSRLIPRGHICPSFYTQYIYPDGTVKVRFCSYHLHDKVSPAVPSIIRQRARELHVIGVDERMMHYNLIPENNKYTPLNSWIVGIVRELTNEDLISMLDFLKENPRQRADFLTKDSFDKLILPVINFNKEGRLSEAEDAIPQPHGFRQKLVRTGIRRKRRVLDPTDDTPLPGNPLIEDEIDKINKLGACYLRKKDLEGFRHYVEVVETLADFVDYDDDEVPHFLVNKRKPPSYIPKFPPDPMQPKRGRGRPRKHPLAPSKCAGGSPNQDDMDAYPDDLDFYGECRDSWSPSSDLCDDDPDDLFAGSVADDAEAVYAEREIKSETRSSSESLSSSDRLLVDEDLPGTSTQMYSPRKRALKRHAECVEMREVKEEEV